MKQKKEIIDYVFSEMFHELGLVHDIYLTPSQKAELTTSIKQKISRRFNIPYELHELDMDEHDKEARKLLKKIFGEDND